MSRRATAPGKQQPSSLMRDDRLLLACLGLFAVFLWARSPVPLPTTEHVEHGSTEQMSALRYLTTRDFVEATLRAGSRNSFRSGFEDWWLGHQAPLSNPSVSASISQRPRPRLPASSPR